MKKKILGTGLIGLVGSRIVELLENQFDFEDLAFDQGFDITKRETIEEKIAFSSAGTLIHLAAFTDVNAAWKEKGDKDGNCYKINVLGTKNIADLCQKYSKQLIHFSTDFIFSGKKDGFYTEEDIPSPIEWYGETKYLAEGEVKNSGNKFCIVRIAFPFRAEFPTKPDLVRKIVEGLKNKTLYPQFSDQIITPTFIDDIAFGIGKIIEKKAEGIFHLTGSSCISPFELAQKIAEVFGLDKSLVKKGSLVDYMTNNPGVRPYQKNASLSNKKAEENLGIKMRTIDEALLEVKKQLNL